jgi:hypothetical protein
MLGNDPVLEPHARIYQRLLAGDPYEATDYAEEYLQEEYLVDFYDHVGIPALVLGELDRQRNVMTEEQRLRFATAAQTLVHELDAMADEEEDEIEDADGTRAADEPPEGPSLPDGEGQRLVCIGGRGEIDDAAAAMVAQVMEVQGADVTVASHEMLKPERFGELVLEGIDTIILAYLNTSSLAQARHAVRRLKRWKSRNLRVGLFVPGAEEAGSVSAMTPDNTNADFVVTTIAAAVRDAFVEEKPTPLKPLPKRRPVRRRPSLKAEAVPA